MKEDPALNSTILSLAMRQPEFFENLSLNRRGLRHDIQL
jgi:hypothetical protein